MGIFSSKDSSDYKPPTGDEGGTPHVDAVKAVPPKRDVALDGKHGKDYTLGRDANRSKR